MTEPLGDARATSFVDSLGPRGRRRAEPRMSIAIAGAGCALAVLGVLMIAGDTGTTDDDFNQVPGIVLSALVVAAAAVPAGPPLPPPPAAPPEDDLSQWMPPPPDDDVPPPPGPT